MATNHTRRAETQNVMAKGRVSARRSKKVRHRKAALGCEFCRRKFNRPDAAFVCPYCGKIWPDKRTTK